MDEKISLKYSIYSRKFWVIVDGSEWDFSNFVLDEVWDAGTKNEFGFYSPEQSYKIKVALNNAAKEILSGFLGIQPQDINIMVL